MFVKLVLLISFFGALKKTIQRIQNQRKIMGFLYHLWFFTLWYIKINIVKLLLHNTEHSQGYHCSLVKGVFKVFASEKDLEKGAPSGIQPIRYFHHPATFSMNLCFTVSRKYCFAVRQMLNINPMSLLFFNILSFLGFKLNLQ
jgi:hypothetical protein